MIINIHLETSFKVTAYPLTKKTQRDIKQIGLLEKNIHNYMIRTWIFHIILL